MKKAGKQESQKNLDRYASIAKSNPKFAETYSQTLDILASEEEKDKEANLLASLEAETENADEKSRSTSNRVDDASVVDEVSNDVEKVKGNMFEIENK